MELLVKNKHGTILLKNAFQNMNEMCIARTLWNGRVNITDYINNYIQLRKDKKSYYGIIISKDNVSVAEVNSQGTFMNSKQLYARGHKSNNFVFQRDIASYVSFVDNYFQSENQTNQKKICTLDYDIPVKTARSEILASLELAKGIGTVKTTLFKYDPQILLTKRRNAMKYLQMDFYKADINSVILEYSRSMWSDHLSHHLSNAISTSDIDEATSFLLAKYYFTLDTVNDFCLDSLVEREDSPAFAFRQEFIRTYLARYCYSLATRYATLDTKELPEDLTIEINRIIKQWTIESMVEL